MEFNHYVQINEMNLSKTIEALQDYSNSKLKSVLKSSFEKFSDIIVGHGLEDAFLSIINKQFRTNYKSMGQLQALKESDEKLNEDWVNFLKFWRGEVYPALSIFPTLQIWFQIDRLLDGANITDLNWKKMAVYAVLWIIIVTGQHMILWNKWKREHPNEWEKEGKPGIFRRKT